MSVLSNWGIFTPRAHSLHPHEATGELWAQIPGASIFQGFGQLLILYLLENRHEYVMEQTVKFS